MKRYPMESEGTRIQSLYKTTVLLEAIRERNGATLTELANRSEFSKSTVYHHLSTLRDCRFVVKDGTEYRIGLRFLTFGGHARERERIYALGRDEVDTLSERANENAQMTVEESGWGISIYQSRADHRNQVATHVGSSLGLHCTAAGKAILAHKPRETIDSWIQNNELVSHTANTITTESRLRDELSVIRDEKVAYDDEEQHEGVRCVAAPVLLETGEILGAVSVSAPVQHVSDTRFQHELPNLLQNASGVIESNAAYAPWYQLETDDN